MRLTLLNSILKRIGFSFGTGALIALLLYSFHGDENYPVYLYSNSYLSFYFVIISSLVVYIPITLFYAVTSTFFTKEEEDINNS